MKKRTERWRCCPGWWVGVTTLIIIAGPLLVPCAHASRGNQIALKTGPHQLSGFSTLFSDDIVVMGVIESVEQWHIPVKDWYGEVPSWIAQAKPLPPGAGIDATAVHVAVDEILRGKYRGSRFRFTLERHDNDLGHNYAVGDTVIVSCRYWPKRLGGSYSIRSDSGRFIRRGSVWVNQAGAGEFALRDIRRMLREETDVRYFAEKADVVAVVRIDGALEPDADADFKEHTKQISRLEASVVRVLKGNLSRASLPIVVGGIRTNTYWWRRRSFPPPNQIDRHGARWTGRWIVFLKRGPVGWYPMGGANGVLRIDGERLLLNNRVEHPYTRKAVELLVAKEVAQ